MAVTLACALAAPMAFPQPAAANPLDKLCSVVGTIGEGWLGKACKVVAHPKQVVGAAKAIASGKPGKAVTVLVNGAKSNVLSASGAIGIAAIVAWAVGGAHFVLSETAKLLGESTSPELTATWFSSVYWRVAGVAALMTLPFLVAAAIQAVLRSDAALLARAVFGYLPLSFLATGIAAPLAMILLQVTDWMGSWVGAAAGDDGSHFLVDAGVALGTLGVAVGSPFVTFLIALLTTAGGLILWLELLIREAAVYVVVLMLPLVFAAMVWPARRVWAVRAVEVLVALILAKFAIVSVLALAAAALTHAGGDLIVRSLAGLVLVVARSVRAVGAFAAAATCGGRFVCGGSRARTDAGAGIARRIAGATRAGEHWRRGLSACRADADVPGRRAPCRRRGSGWWNEPGCCRRRRAECRNIATPRRWQRSCKDNHIAPDASCADHTRSAAVGGGQASARRTGRPGSRATPRRRFSRRTNRARRSSHCRPADAHRRVPSVAPGRG